ncbi:MAG: hypothetical protein K0R41_845 [Geminicoccaceae bacterium]|jgi:hypothetical protein|nr:hypothetical protein [Geminicoccaceae bacterium]MCE3247020.1 hypothetical protein [Geminicoccaceae bacterium]MDF2766652.1 hypothetical protein [Rhodospirillales bacterium]
MKRKALALIVASSLATAVGAASAADLDQVSEAVDLAGLAELILDEYLNLAETSTTDAEDFALAIGFTFGVAFSSDGLTFTDALSEGLVLTGADPDSFAYIGTIANTLAAPGLAGFNTGLDAVAFDPPNPGLLAAAPVSDD